MCFVLNYRPHVGASLPPPTEDGRFALQCVVSLGVQCSSVLSVLSRQAFWSGLIPVAFLKTKATSLLLPDVCYHGLY